jgi:16S rRNA (guanine1516-N2)-methyltransferase
VVLCEKGQVNQGYQLLVDDTGIALYPNDSRLHGPIRVDFNAGANSHRRKFGGGNGQAIAKAVGVSGAFLPSVLDLTAGLGGDAFVLASLGCEVRLFERNSIISCLLRDGIERATLASQDDYELRDVMRRLVFVEGDSIDALKQITEDDRPDIIYLDPMFPHRKKSAKVKKEMQAFQNIVGGDEDSGALLEHAVNSARYRVVVKRASNAEFLAGLKPTYSLTGKSTRFDIFALRKIPS